MSSILGTYARKNISFKSGKGSYLFSENGEKYLDFVQGIAVNVLGHCHEDLVKTIHAQSKKLLTNGFLNEAVEKITNTDVKSLIKKLTGIQE